MIKLCPKPQYLQLCWMSAAEVAQDFSLCGVRRILAELPPFLLAFCGVCCLSLFSGDVGEPDIPQAVLVLCEVSWEGLAAGMGEVQELGWLLLTYLS